MALGISDYQTLLRVIESLHAAQTLTELRQATHEGLAAMVPGDCHDMVLLAGSPADQDLFLAQTGTYTQGEMLYMLKNAEKHPLVEPFRRGDPGAVCVSQVVSVRQWWNTEFYHESGYQRLRLKHELAALVPNVRPTGMASVSVLRDRDFSERDREMINHLRPHLSLAWRRAIARESAVSPARIRKAFPMLSEREADVLFWITEGKQNREIAEILERSLNTVQEHVENIVRKLGLENRHEATVFALRNLING